MDSLDWGMGQVESQIVHHVLQLCGPSSNPVSQGMHHRDAESADEADRSYVIICDPQQASPCRRQHGGKRSEFVDQDMGAGGGAFAAERLEDGRLQEGSAPFCIVL